jgi:hypothetical protein
MWHLMEVQLSPIWHILTVIFVGIGVLLWFRRKERIRLKNLPSNLNDY